MAIIVRGAPQTPRLESMIFLQRINSHVQIRVVLHGARHRTQNKFEGLAVLSSSSWCVTHGLFLKSMVAARRMTGTRPSAMSPFEPNFQGSGRIWRLAMKKNLLTAVELEGLLYGHALENVPLHFLIGIGEPRE